MIYDLLFIIYYLLFIIYSIGLIYKSIVQIHKLKETLKIILMYHVKKGLFCRSTPILVSGPCPGYTIVSSGRFSKLSFILCKSV